MVIGDTNWVAPIAFVHNKGTISINQEQSVESARKRTVLILHRFFVLSLVC